jgi:hypothetical protein
MTQEVKFKSVDEALAFHRERLSRLDRDEVLDVANACASWFNDEDTTFLLMTEKEIVEWILSQDPVIAEGGLFDFFASMEKRYGRG